MINWFLLFNITVTIVILALIAFFLEPITRYYKLAANAVTTTIKLAPQIGELLPKIISATSNVIAESLKPAVALTKLATSTTISVEEFIPVLVKTAIVPLGKVTVIAIDQSAQLVVKTGQLLERALPVVGKIVAAVFDGTGTVIATLADNFNIVLDPTIKLLHSTVSLATTVVDEGTALSNVVLNSFSVIIEPVMSLVDQLKITGDLNINAFNDFNKVISDLPPTIESVGTSLASFLSAGFGGTAKGVDFAAKIINTIYTPINVLLGGLKSAVSAITHLPEQITGIVNTVGNIVVHGITDPFNGVINDLKSGYETIKDGLEKLNFLHL